ncbi:hypothetical protein GUJ93_ZPchr0006g41798 [Zizania palustris]|uniref:Uncharacterized protein n=1 Tax=Zizania palustris TaxID=103762 RepID=A0A8J5VXI9_ZIZPA|nr:hypothetical protein GUJ93_ZPchr0006g41798 [Zizania palustris]
MRGSGEEVGGGDLWVKAAELERQFEGYKRRLAERRASAAAAVVDRPLDFGGGADEEATAVGRGRRYEAYARRRDEKLRQGWRARMERKETEMKALWARLDRRRDGELATSPDSEQKPGNLEVKPISPAPATPRCRSAMKRHGFSRPGSTKASPASAAASPRLSSNSDARRRALHRETSTQAELPATPRKENRMPSQPSSAVSTAVTTTPRLRALSRSRCSPKDSDISSSVRESPRTPRFQFPRPSHDGAGKRQRDPVAVPTTADAIAPAAQICQNHLAEINMVAAFRLRRSGNAAGQPASPRPVITRQVDIRSRSDTGSNSNAQNSRNSDIESNNCSFDEGNSDNDTAHSSVKLANFKITGDSGTELSYVYIKKDSEEEATNTSQAMAGSGSDTEESEKETGDLQEITMVAAKATAKESPVTDGEDTSHKSSDSSESFYSNVQSSFSHRSELASSATDSPLHSSPSSSGPSTEQLLEAEAAMLRKKREEEEEVAVEIKNLLIPITPTSSTVVCSVAVQSPTEAVAGLKRFLTFGKKNIKTGAEAAAAEHEALAMAPLQPDGGSVGLGQGWPPGDSVRPRICSSDAASDDPDNTIVISHVRSMQSCLPSSVKPVLLKEVISSAKSPRG